MEKSRMAYATKNAVISFAVSIVQLILGFVVQTVFIRELGKSYLGLNGLFTNILTYLSLAELGVGSAIVFSLYKPIASGDDREVAALMNFYRKAYRGIAAFVGVVGLAILPIIPMFIKGNVENHIGNVYLYFFLFLANSVCSYLLAYKRSIFSASQRDYVNQVNYFLFYLFQIILQIIILLVWQNYALFLVIQVLATVFGNLYISHKVDKEFVYLKQYKKENISRNDFLTIKKNVFELVGSKLGGILVNGTDNILISTFVGLSTVGIYSNYAMIATAVNLLQGKITSATVASIGNFGATEKNEKADNLFRLHFFVNFVINFSCSVVLLNLYNPFITLWLGKDYTFLFPVVLVIVINNFIYQVRQTALSFINGFGAFRFSGIKSVVEGIINLLLSLSLMYFFRLGIEGTLLATIFTSIFISGWFEIYQVYHFKLQIAFSKILSFVSLRVVIGIGGLIGIHFLISMLALKASWINIIITAVLTEILALVMISIFFGFTKEYRETLGIAIKFIKRKI